jgi:hypothetical protein
MYSQGSGGQASVCKSITAMIYKWYHCLMYSPYYYWVKIHLIKYNSQNSRKIDVNSDQNIALGRHFVCKTTRWTYEMANDYQWWWGPISILTMSACLCHQRACIVKLSSWVKGKKTANLKVSVPACVKWQGTTKPGSAVIDIRLQHYVSGQDTAINLPIHCMALLETNVGKKASYAVIHSFKHECTTSSLDAATYT